MEINRKKTKQISVGSTAIGGDAPVCIQSMTSVSMSKFGALVSQIKKLEEAGAELIRVAVPDMKSALCLGRLKKKMKVPLIADIHYDYKLALESIKQGVDKIRINPGNIGGFDRVKLIIDSARQKNVPIRIGVNSGSLKILQQGDKFHKLDSKMRAHHMVKELIEYIKYFEKENYTNLILSLKSSDVLTTLSAYRMIANLRDYPLHLGITEAGDVMAGTVQSCIGIGTLLAEGIGDTIRVSLTADPVQEIKVAREIIKALGLRNLGPRIISCPTCGRCQVDIMNIVGKTGRMIEKMTKTNPKLNKSNMKIALMGCSVNGPGEARDADIGFAGGKKWGIFFKNGKQIKRLKSSNWLNLLEKEISLFSGGSKK